MSKEANLKKIKLFAKSILEIPEEQFQLFLDRFDKIWRTAKGRTDIKSKLMLLLAPDKPQTTAFLTKSQGYFTSFAFFMADSWIEFLPLREYAIQMCLSSLGVEGKGIDASVRLTGALSESKMLQRLGIQIKGSDSE